MFKLLLISLMLPCIAMAQATEQKTVVLIHGAFAMVQVGTRSSQSSRLRPEGCRRAESPDLACR